MVLSFWVFMCIVEPLFLISSVLVFSLSLFSWAVERTEVPNSFRISPGSPVFPPFSLDFLSLNTFLWMVGPLVQRRVAHRSKTTNEDSLGHICSCLEESIPAPSYPCPYHTAPQGRCLVPERLEEKLEAPFGSLFCGLLSGYTVWGKFLEPVCLDTVIF